MNWWKWHFGKRIDSYTWLTDFDIDYVDRYCNDWCRDHPSIDTMLSGGFGGSGIVWYSATPEWDLAWFKRHNIRPPKYIVNAVDGTLYPQYT